MEWGFLFGGAGVLPEAAEFGIEFWVGCFIDRVPWLDAVEIDTAEGFVENDAVVLDFPDARALFEIAVFPGIEDHAVTRHDGNSGELGQLDPAGSAIGDLS